MLGFATTWAVVFVRMAKKVPPAAMQMRMLELLGRAGICLLSCTAPFVLANLDSFPFWRSEFLDFTFGATVLATLALLTTAGPFALLRLAACLDRIQEADGLHAVRAPIARGWVAVGGLLTASLVHTIIWKPTHDVASPAAIGLVVAIVVVAALASARRF